MRKTALLFMSIILCGIAYGQNTDEIGHLIDKGELSQAQKMIKQELFHNDTLSQAQAKAYKEQLKRIDNIREDYPFTHDKMFKELKAKIPDLTPTDILKWEKDTSLEYRMIDGQKKYFWALSFNLFALNKDAESRRLKKDSPENKPKKYDPIIHKNAVIAQSVGSNTPYILPKKIKVCFTFFEDATGIPEGEIIRGWLPVPRATSKQRDKKILEVVPKDHILSNSSDNLVASLYVEKKVKRNDKETAYWRDYFTNPPVKWITPLSSPDKAIHKDTIVFQVMFEYTAFAHYQNIEPQEISPYNTSSSLYQRYTREEPPHLQFTESLSHLSNEIIGDETNDYLKAKRIYEWICKNVTWTNPDYDSPNCLSDYTAKAKRGDCGSKALLFTALCRYNGIPARLQGGWMTRPHRMHSQHGWAQIHIEPYGWLTVDPDAGSHLIDQADERLKYFHFGNCDSYRLIIYDDRAPLFPYKIFGDPSGGDITGALQLGAFEWAGGELESNVKIDTWVEER